MFTDLAKHFPFTTESGIDVVCVGNLPKEMDLVRYDYDFGEVFRRLGASNVYQDMICVPHVTFDGDSELATYMLKDDYDAYCIGRFDKRDLICLCLGRDDDHNVSDCARPSMIDVDLCRQIENISDDELTPLRQNRRQQDRVRQRKDNDVQKTRILDFINNCIEDTTSQISGNDKVHIDNLVGQMKRMQNTCYTMDLVHFQQRFVKYIRMQAFWNFMIDEYVQDCLTTSNKKAFISWRN